MRTTCDFCFIKTNLLSFDDSHPAMGGYMYGFFCALCYEINDKYFLLDGVWLKAELEISMNRRYFNRIRKELNNV